LKRGSGWTRAGLGVRSLLAAGLAVGAAVLAVDLSDWKYLRADLTAARSNTLDPAVLDVIDALPEPVVVDVFLRALKPPYDRLSLHVHDRLLEFLTIVHNARRDRIDVRIHDPRDFEKTQERLLELGTSGTHKVVVSCGGRRDELAVVGELFTIDWGNPTEELGADLTEHEIAGVVDPRTWRRNAFLPASVQEFRGEELLTQALMKVSSGTAPKAVFPTGHGEPSLDGPEPTDLARLKAALERDGFEIGEWDPLASPGVPEDTDVLALIGAAQPYQPATRAAIRAWAEAGGRLLAAPDLRAIEERREGGIAELLLGFGIATRPGIVCQPFVGVGGEKVDGVQECAWLVIDERGLQPGHPLTEPLRTHRRRVQFTLTPAFESAGDASAAGIVLPLITSTADAWLDLDHDFRFNAAKGEKRDRYTLATARQLRTVKADDGSIAQGRVLAVASAYFFGNQLMDVNRDFAVNAFNWLAEREYRISVSPLEKRESHLDLARSRAKPVLTWSLLFGLPLACAVVGALVFLARRR
jgi:hypothetical protein